MPYVKGKTSRPKYNRWGKNPRNVNTSQALMLTNPAKEQYGATVLYRRHLGSMGKLDPAFSSRDEQQWNDPDFREDLKTSFNHLPPTLRGAIPVNDNRYPDEAYVPCFIRGKVIKKGGQYINTVHCVVIQPGTNHNLSLVVEGTLAWFVEYNRHLGFIRGSATFSTDRARAIVGNERALAHLYWVNTISLPD